MKNSDSMEGIGKEIREIIIKDIVGRSAMENWGVKSFDDQFLEIGNIASNRFGRLVDKIEKVIKKRGRNESTVNTVG